MKRAVLELSILLGLMLVAGTAYTLSIRENAEKALPWVSPVLPSGWPQLPTARVADHGGNGNGGSSDAAPAAETVATPAASATGTTPVEPVSESTGSAGDVGPSGDTGSADVAAEPAGPFRFIDHEETVRHFEDGIALFIDSRRTREYVDGHIQGARSISYWEADADEKIGALREEVPLEIPIVVYCTRSKDCEDSQFLAQKLHEVGFLDLMVYRGGFPEWKQKEPTRVVTGREPGER